MGPRQASLPQARRVVVVVPTYDERENVSEIITAVLAEQKSAGSFDLHVLIADSHSSDGTLEIVERLSRENPNVHLLDVQERGIGVGLYKGFRHAIDELGADVLFEMDADFQHNPADIPRFLEQIGQGYDLVVGSRFAPGSVNRMPWYRRILSVGANQVIRVMLHLYSVTEITTSYRAFTKELFLKVDPASVPWREQSFIFVPVFLVRMIEAGANATEIPMTMHSRVRGQSKMVYWKYILDIMRFSVKARLQR
jgi:dolichol-phosphate mannosyltransferase